MSSLDIDSPSRKSSIAKDAQNWVTFVLNSNGSVAAFSYEESYLRENSSGSEFIAALLTERLTGDIRVDLREYKASSFSWIFNLLVTNERSMLNSNLDLEDINKLCNYLGLTSEMMFRISTDVNYLFPRSLLQQDRILRNREITLRKNLYNNEEVDMRYLDAEFRFEKVSQEMNYQLKEIPYAKLSEVDSYRNLYRGGDHVIFSSNLDTFEPENHLMRPPNHHKHEGFTDTFKRDVVRESVKESYLIGNRTVEDGSYPMIGRVRSIPGPESRYLHFKELFDIESHRAFVDLDFTDLCLAGGLNFNLLTGFDGGKTRKLFSPRKEVVVGDSDYDFFLITKDPVRAEAAIERVIAAVKNLYKSSECQFEEYEPGEVQIVRTAGAITISFRWNDGLVHEDANSHLVLFKVQIVLRLYNSITQVIAGFDVDSCCVAWDGKQLYAMPRFIRSLKYGYNLADPERQSKNYHIRLFKYLNRGVAIALPGYDSKRVVPELQAIFKPKGLAKIVAYYYKMLLRVDSLVTRVSNRIDHGNFPIVIQDLLTENMRRDIDDEKDCYDQVGTTLALAYYTNFPNATDDLDAIVYHIKNSIQRTGNIPSILVGLTFDTVKQDPFHIMRGEPLFRVKNSGSQLTNSFNPTNDDWYHDLYVHNSERDFTLIHQNLREPLKDPTDNKVIKQFEEPALDVILKIMTYSVDPYQLTAEQRSLISDAIDISDLPNSDKDIVSLRYFLAVFGFNLIGQSSPSYYIGISRRRLSTFEMHLIDSTDKYDIVDRWVLNIDTKTIVGKVPKHILKNRSGRGPLQMEITDAESLEPLTENEIDVVERLSLSLPGLRYRFRDGM